MPANFKTTRPLLISNITNRGFNYDIHCNRETVIFNQTISHKNAIVTCIYTALKVKGKRALTQLQCCVASAVQPISLVHLCEALLAQKEARCAHVHRKSKVDINLEINTKELLS